MKTILAFLSFLFLAFSANAKTVNVAILAFDEMNILDFAGPTEVFFDAGRALESLHKDTSVKVFSVGYPSKKVRTLEGPFITTDYKISDAPKADILILPGGAVMGVEKNPDLKAWIIKHSQNSKQIASVCTGAFFLAEAGLLDGKKATTHAIAIDLLRKKYPKIEVLEGVRYVDEGNILTTGGVSAGIDGSLFLVKRNFGEEVEDIVRRIMEYPYK